MRRKNINCIRSRWEEKIVAEHMKMNYNKVQYEKTIYVSRETYKSL